MACLAKNDEIVSQIKEMLRRKNKTKSSFNPKSAIVQASFSSRFFPKFISPLVSLHLYLNTCVLKVSIVAGLGRPVN